MRSIFKKLPAKLKLWQLVLPLLALANAAYLTRNILGAVITLGFFLFIPGYLLLSKLKHGIKSRWEIASFSLGLSILLLMVGGLALNSLHGLGLDRPLTTFNIFVMLDILTLGLLVLVRKKTILLYKYRLRPNLEESVFIGSLTMLPLLAIGGAIRLNNGGSNELAMAVFGLVPLLFILLLRYKRLTYLYPYAIFMIGLTVLLATSMRGWFITGHDIHHEFHVFQQTLSTGFWSSRTSTGDPYNTCLSITILPTILAKISSISSPYIYKVVFQFIFAFALIPSYRLFTRFVKPRVALVGTLVVISFPTFLNDMTFLNRQEVAFLFFGLLMLATFTKISRQAKTLITIFCLIGLIVAHYSSSYATLGILLIAWIFYKLFTLRKSIKAQASIPILSLPIIITAMLLTFMWNSQIAGSTSNLQSTAIQTVRDLLSGSSSKAGFVQYSLVGSETKSPEAEFTERVQGKAPEARYSPISATPISWVGEKISRFVDARNLNVTLHALCAKIFQLLLITGVFVYFWRNRRADSQQVFYYVSISMASLSMLVLLTILPRLSVDYSVIRMFQHVLLVIGILLVTGSDFILALLGKFRHYATIALVLLLFLNLSGLIPRALGGASPNIALDNAGAYYEYFYTHESDRVATKWLTENRDERLLVFMDDNTDMPPVDYYVQLGLINETNRPNNSTGYLYHNYINTTQHKYRINLNSEMSGYTDPSPTRERNLIYADTTSNIYGKK